MTKIPSGMMMAMSYFNVNASTMGLMETDAIEGDGSYYDVGENGWDPGTGV
jgi:hypothetical protein